MPESSKQGHDSRRRQILDPGHVSLECVKTDATRQRIWKRCSSTKTTSSAFSLLKITGRTYLPLRFHCSQVKPSSRGQEIHRKLRVKGRKSGDKNRGDKSYSTNTSHKVVSPLIPSPPSLPPPHPPTHPPPPSTTTKTSSPGIRLFPSLASEFRDAFWVQIAHFFFLLQFIQ